MMTRVVLAVAAALLLAGCRSLERFEPENLFAGTRPGDYLSAREYSRLVIEVLPVEGVAAYGGVDLEAVARAQCNKPGGVSLVTREAIPRALAWPRKWTDAKLLALRDRWATQRTRGETVVLHVLFVPGGYEDGYTTTGGVVFTHDLICIFPDVGMAPRLAAVVAIHEFGHILGLVNNGTPARSDHGDDGHCKTPACVMFESSSAPGVTTAFDAACLEDLRRR
jgi:hypothetical protein